MQKITPMAKKIQDKYKNDKEKQAEELTKLYSKIEIAKFLKNRKI